MTAFRVTACSDCGRRISLLGAAGPVLSASTAAGLSADAPRRSRGQRQRCETCETQRASTRIKICLLLISAFLSYLWYLNLTEADGRYLASTAERVTTWLAPPPPRPVAALVAEPPPVRRASPPRRPQAAPAIAKPRRSAPSVQSPVRRMRRIANPAPDLQGLY